MSPRPPAVLPAELIERRLEVCVFLFLIVPPMVLGLLGGAESVGFDLAAAATVLTDLGLVALVLFFLWRNAEPLADAGLTRRRVGRELLLGVALYPLVGIGIALVQSGFEKLGLSPPPATTPKFLAAHGGWQLAFAVVLVLVVAVSEEILFRGYLLLRFDQIQTRRSVAVVLSAVIFSLGHGYEGGSGLATVLALGIALGVIRLWRNSLAAPIVIHAIQDFIGIVIAPLLHK